MNNIERELIIEVFKYNPNKEKIKEIILSNNINWPLILGFISYHRIAGLFYEKFNDIDVRLLDYPVFFSTYMINQSQKLRFMVQDEEIKKISSAIEKYNIKHVFLKGAVLNQTVFNSGSRASNDIDILINKESIIDVTKALNDIGFVQGRYNYKKNLIEKFSKEELKESIIKRGETCPFVKINDNLAIRTIDVDLNFSLDWNPNFDQNIINKILNSRIKLNSGNGFIYSANIYYNLIELCTHLYKDMALLDIVSKRKVFDFYKIIDIYYLIKKYYNDINFSEFEKLTYDTNSSDYVYYALSYILEIFDDMKTKELLNLLDNLETTVRSKDILDTIFDQYNSNIRYKTNAKIIDRIFSYNVLDLYSIQENKEK